MPYPYPYVDPSYGGLFCSAYGQMASNVSFVLLLVILFHLILWTYLVLDWCQLHDSDQTQAQVNSNVVGSTPARVPLPHGLAEDGLIYVNAKQYHGIIRRRKSRAKLEAQNKVIRNRKVSLSTELHLNLIPSFCWFWTLTIDNQFWWNLWDLNIGWEELERNNFEIESKCFSDFLSWHV